MKQLSWYYAIHLQSRLNLSSSNLVKATKAFEYDKWQDRKIIWYAFEVLQLLL